MEKRNNNIPIPKTGKYKFVVCEACNTVWKKRVIDRHTTQMEDK